MKIFLFTLLFSTSVFAQSKCFLEGRYDLEIFPASSPMWLQGTVGNTQMRLDVFKGFSEYEYRVTGWIKNESVTLDLKADPRESFINLAGWIHNYYIVWYGSGTRLTGIQNCIPQ